MIHNKLNDSRLRMGLKKFRIELFSDFLFPIMCKWSFEPHRVYKIKEIPLFLNC